MGKGSLICVEACKRWGVPIGCTYQRGRLGREMIGICTRLESRLRLIRS